MSDARSFFAELERRKVYRAGLGYVVASLALWGAIEIASQAFGLSDRVLQMVIIASVVGLPVILVAAWLFDLRIEWTSRIGVGVVAGMWVVLGVSAGMAVMFGWGLTAPESPPTVFRHVLSGLGENHARFGDFELGASGFYYRAGGQFWYRRWDDLTAEPILASNTAAANKISPDGTQMAQVVIGGELQLIPLDGGPMRVLADSMSSGIRWGGDGYLYVPRLGASIHRVPLDGSGLVESLNIEVREGEIPLSRFNLLPGGSKAVIEVRGEVDRIEGWASANGRGDRRSRCALDQSTSRRNGPNPREDGGQKTASRCMSKSDTETTWHTAAPTRTPLSLSHKVAGSRGAYISHSV